MAIRGFGNQTLTGTPQPAFGTTITTGFSVTPDPYTGNTQPRSQPSTSTVPVTSLAFYRQNDRVQVGPAGGPYDEGTISAINIGSTYLTIKGLQRSHAAGEWVILSIQCARVQIRGNASLIYIGEDNTVGAASATLADYLNPGSIYITESTVGNSFGTSHYWLLGTAADTYLPSLLLI